MKARILSWLIFGTAVILIWQGVVSFRLVSPAALASPWEVAASLPRLFRPAPSGSISHGGWEDVRSTIGRSLVAFFLSVPIGVGTGLAVFSLGRKRGPAEFTMDFLRSIPATALVPVFLILTAADENTKVAIGTFSSSLVICLATISGLHNRSATRLAMARLLSLRGWRRIWLLDLPEALPQLFVGLKTGVSLALILVVVSEMMITSNRGLGKIINDMRHTDDKGLMYAAIIMTGAIGYGYNLVLSWCEIHLLHWRGRQ